MRLSTVLPAIRERKNGHQQLPENAKHPLIAIRGLWELQQGRVTNNVKTLEELCYPKILQPLTGF